MKNTMQNGRLSGSISLDTIAPRKNLYGIGPLAYLNGELMVLDGVPYVSKVTSDSTMSVTQNFQVEAPFFVYGHVSEWQQLQLPEEVKDLETLENYLDKVFAEKDSPVVFRIKTKVSSATIHIVNLPPDAEVRSKKDAHQGITYYTLENEDVEILGFFSRKHQTIFTHHDTFIHLHLITKNREKMGHLDEAIFENGSLFY